MDARTFQQAYSLSDGEMLDLVLAYIGRQDSDDALEDYLDEQVDDVKGATARVMVPPGPSNDARADHHYRRCSDDACTCPPAELAGTATADDEARLASLEAEFDAAGGRGVELAERIDALRLKLHPEDYELAGTSDYYPEFGNCTTETPCPDRAMKGPGECEHTQ